MSVRLIIHYTKLVSVSLRFLFFAHERLNSLWHEVTSCFRMSLIIQRFASSAKVWLLWRKAMYSRTVQILAIASCVCLEIIYGPFSCMFSVIFFSQEVLERTFTPLDSCVYASLHYGMRAILFRVTSVSLATLAEGDTLWDP